MDAILESLEPCLPLNSFEKLSDPIFLQELGSIAKELAHECSPGLDGHAIKFYVKLWSIIGPEFHSLILHAIHTGELPKGMNKGLIALLHKDWPSNLFKSYRPITLLNTS